MPDDWTPRDQKLVGLIIARLCAEGARSLSDEELERCLAPCVGNALEPAKHYRDEGFLTMDDITPKPEQPTAHA